MASSKKRKTIEAIWKGVSVVKETIGALKTWCGVSRIDRGKPKTTESREVLTSEGSDMKQKEKRWRNTNGSTFFNGNQDNQANGNSKESAENVNCSHNIKKIYNYLTSNKLNDQNTRDKTNPETIDTQFITPSTRGSTNTEAKKTWPMSRQISDKTAGLINETNFDKIEGAISADNSIERKIVQNPDADNFPSVLDIKCSFCGSTEFVRRGTRKNRYQSVQLYLCKNLECGRTFTAQDVKGKHFPLNVVIEGISYYNLGCTFEGTCAILRKKFGVNPGPATLSAWVEEYKGLCRFERLRPYAVKMYSPRDMVEVVTMAHRQLYRFRYHRAKIRLMLEEFGNRNLSRMKDYLDAVSSETPHQYFQDGERMSEIKSKFDKADMLVKSKTNYANRLAAFVLQAVVDNNARHEAIQRFFLANDSVTVATEVPVYIRREDVSHMENILRFKISDNGLIQFKGKKQEEKMPHLLTGHIDIVQIRNGQVHILDYKPNAAKERPIEQLTWYALALSRLTGMRLFQFTCAWFDEKDYYQFFPLHVVKKLQTAGNGKKKRRRFVRFKDGTKVEVPRESPGKAVVV